MKWKYGIIICVLLLVGIILVGYVVQKENISKSKNCIFPETLGGLVKFSDQQITLAEKQIRIVVYTEKQNYIIESSKAAIITIEKYNNLQDAVDQYDARKGTFRGAYSPEQGGLISGNCFMDMEGTIESGIKTNFYCEGEDAEKFCTIGNVNGRCVTVDRNDFLVDITKNAGWEGIFVWLEGNALKEVYIDTRIKGEHPIKSQKLDQMKAFVEQIEKCEI